MKTRHAIKKKRSEKMSRRVGRIRGKKKEDENEDDDVFELATGQNAPMFWGDVDKKLLHHRSKNKNHTRRAVARKKHRAS